MKHARGFTLIELLVVICVVALVFGAALDRLTRYQELAERTAMEQNVAAINVAVTMKFAALMLAGNGALMAKDEGTNPVRLLARAPENYLGELYSPEQGTLPRPSWYYDLGSRELVYLPARARFLETEDKPGARLRFRLTLTEPSSESAPLREIRQPYLKAVQPFRWSIE